MINLTIDGKSIAVEEGKTILDAAKENGIDIPTLCFLKGVNEIGSCRMCMVEQEGRDTLLPACRSNVKEGMVLYTKNERLIKYRRQMLNLLLSNHNLDCMSCSGNGLCKLQALCNEYEVTRTTYKGSRYHIESTLEKLDSNPFISYDPSKCIHCQTCISACNNRAVNKTMKSGRTGVFHTVDAPFGPDWKSTSCESCGVCAAACPTGALSIKRRENYREWQVKRVLTTCPHCATGCQFYLVVKDNRIVNVEAADGPSNHGLLCVKGRSGSFDFVQSEDRLKKPLIKNRETGEFREASWEEAISYTAENLMRIKKEYGGDALAGFACSRSANEDIYMVPKQVLTIF